MWLFLRPFLPYLLGVGLALAGAGGLYWYIRHQGVLAEREAVFRAQVAEYQAAVAKAQAISVDLETKLHHSRAEVTKLNGRLRHELGKDPVYRECVLPDDGVQLLDSAIATSNALTN